MDTNKYSQRVNDPSERVAWEKSGLVAVSSLSSGQKFEDISGKLFVLNRKETNGVCHVHYMDTGAPDSFCGFAIVRPLDGAK